MINQEVLDDVVNHSDGKTHMFSDIFEGRTALHPQTQLYMYNVDPNILDLYSGGFGMGNYVHVTYSKTDNKYRYLTAGYGDKWDERYSSEDWESFREYVRKEIFDVFQFLRRPL